MKIYHLILLALFMILFIFTSCVPRSRIIDKDTYLVELNKPEHKIIIQTPDGNKIFMGYLEMQQISPPTLKEIGQTLSVEPIIQTDPMGGIARLTFKKKWGNSMPIKNIHKLEQVFDSIWDLDRNEELGKVGVLFDNNNPLFYYLKLLNHYFIDFKFRNERLSYRSIEKSK